MSSRKFGLITLSSIFFFIIVPSLTIFLGVRIDEIISPDYIEIGVFRIIISLLFFLTGAYYVLESIRVLYSKGGGVPLGDVFPEDQSLELLEEGIYAQTRNPMLFGYLLCIISVGVYLQSFSITLLLPGVYLILWTVWLLKYEEPSLKIRFGDHYNRYREETPFLIPIPRRKKRKYSE
jgi:protein-S-isoprenylcysteine O-methyltransferase Ste14